jgi:amino acid adenylation domain-containing protein
VSSFLPTDLVAMLQARAAEQPDSTALVFQLAEPDRLPVSYRQLDARARAVAVQLRDGAGVRPGDRVLLLYPPGIDYVSGFFGCLYAGAVAVPVFPPRDARGFARVAPIVREVDAAAALLEPADLEGARAGLRAIGAGRSPTLLTMTEATGAADWQPVRLTGDSLAFLQYTSGSTSTPKGVMVSHDNLLHNSAAIAELIGAEPSSRGVSWLPPYHDMGLIGGIIQPLYSGFPCLLMPPLAFLRRPVQWLRAIDEFGATVSAAPDFAYLECVRRVSAAEAAELDLGRWHKALVGAEPVRAQTLEAFADRFAVSGFRPRAFVPCYGLAEATLLVTGAGDGPVERRLDRTALGQDQVLDGGVDGIRLVGSGRAGGSDRVAIVDARSGERCPPGRIGEVWVSGRTVAGGYWARPELTGPTYRAALAGDDQPWLRTGDLGFLDGDELYLTGRLKDLITVRGANHYPQDIEQTAGLSNPALPPGRGAAFGVDDGTQENVVLVHEVAGRQAGGDLQAVLEAARAAVFAEHGLALQEVVLVRPGGVPRTSSGKVRRRATREGYLKGTLPVLARSGPGRPVDPEPAEGADPLLALVAAVLDVPAGTLDPTRPLVAQGLDSLRAVRLSAELDLDPAQVLAAATVAELASLLAAGGQTREPAPIARLADAGPAPASLGQQRLWLLHELGAEAAYHVTGLVRLPVEPDHEAVRGALRFLLERHESLRTAVRPTPEGDLEQVVEVAVDVPVELIDVLPGDLEPAVRAWARRPFELERAPLIRAALLRSDGENRSWALAFCTHHIISDGWSFAVLAREFGIVYAALAEGRTPQLEPIPLRYRDFAAWQRQGSSGTAGDPEGPDPQDAESLAFWRSRLTGLAPPDLSGGARSDLDSAGADLPVRLPAELVAELREVARDRGATLFMVLAAAFGAVLGRLSGRSDILFGTASAGRAHRDLSEPVGFFVNTLPISLSLDGDPSFTELIDRARSTCLEAYRHQDVPFERIVQEVRPDRGSAGHRSLVRHLLVLQDSRPAVRFGGQVLPATVLPPDEVKVDLELELAPDPDGGLSGSLLYATALFERSDAERLVAALHHVLDAGTDRPATRVSSLPLMDDDTRDLVVEVFTGARSRPVTEPPVPRWFEAQVDATPAGIAVVGPDGVATRYAELDRLANRLAGRLRAWGVGRESRVAVCLERGLPLSVALLGILKAGAAYLPLDPGYPPERLRQFLDDGAPVIVLCSPELADRVASTSGRVVLLGPDGQDLTPQTTDQPQTTDLPQATDQPEAADQRLTVTLEADNAGYVLFTSGSTGRPKAAVNTHGGLTNRLHWAQAAHRMGPGDRILQKTPIGFDVSLWELLLPLVSGATLVYARPDGHRDPQYLHALLDEQRVSVCHFVPSMLRAFLDEPSGPHPHLRLVVCSGEELPTTLAERFLDRFPGVQLDNLYGPTEAAVDVTAHRVDPPVVGRVPIGTPVTGAELYVLDATLAPIPPGVPGDLYIGGAQLARGYLGRPGLTAERFVPHPFRNGQRLYATGDRARWSASGELAFLGRSDDQVKIRGNRVELGEVEACLLTHPGVTGAAVVVRGPADEPYLVGYVTGGPDAPTPRELRGYLHEHLPGSMVPAVIQPLAALPLLANGKIDRSALPATTGSTGSTGSTGATGTVLGPRTPVERILAGIWAEALGTEPVGVDQDFFELGGHSLLAIRVVSRVRAEFGVELSVADLLTGRLTVIDLAELVRARQVEHASEQELAELVAALAEMSDDQVSSRLAEFDEQR